MAKFGNSPPADVEWIGKEIVGLEYNCFGEPTDLRPLTTLRSLRKLTIWFNDVLADDQLEELKGLDNLRSLDLRGTRITDDGVKHLKNLTNLQELSLCGTRITDAGLEHLQGLNNLTVLDLGVNQITDAGLEHLAVVTTLREVWLHDTRVTDEGVRKLKQRMPNCSIHWGPTMSNGVFQDLKCQ